MGFCVRIVVSVFLVLLVVVILVKLVDFVVVVVLFVDSVFVLLGMDIFVRLFVIFVSGDMYFVVFLVLSML